MFDAFETRMQFLQLLRKLNASQQSIQKVVSFAIKYGSRCGEDLWECIYQECGKGSLNARINIFYLLDTLVEASLPLGPADAPYPELVTLQLGEIVDRVVPDTREGILNLKSVKQILESWRLRRLVESNLIDQVLSTLDSRKHHSDSAQKRSHEHAFSKNEILRRMEEDRERHKRLRERIWILPIPSLIPSHPASQSQSQTNYKAHPLPQASPSNSSSTTSPFTPVSPSRRSMAPPPPPAPSPAPGTTADADAGSGSGTAHGHGIAAASASASALDVEFDQIWETTSELDEEDYTKMRADAQMAGPNLVPPTT